MSYLPVTPDLRPLGKSGIDVSPIAWGMWRFAGVEIDAARRLVEAALSVGVTLFDTADIYGYDGANGFGDAERLLGRVFADAPALRGRMVLATKGGILPPLPYDSSIDYLTTALDASLRRLGVDQVDLYQIHRPDMLTHPHEAARALENAVVAGKVRAVGVSNYTPAQVQALRTFLSVPLSSIQPELSPLAIAPIESGLLDDAMAHGIAVLGWSPLGGGRIGTPQSARERAVADAIDRKADEVGVSRAVAAYSWIMAHPAGPIPIVGTQNIDRIAEIADVTKARWTRQEWYEVLVASRGEQLP